MPELVGNPEDRFSHNEAHIILVIRNPALRILCKNKETKKEIRCVVIAQLLIRACIFDSLIQFLVFLNTKFATSSRLLCLYSRVVSDLIENPIYHVFSRRVSILLQANLSLVIRNPAFGIYAKTKTQISFAVTAKLSAFHVYTYNTIPLPPKSEISSLLPSYITMLHNANTPMQFRNIHEKYESIFRLYKLK